MVKLELEKIHVRWLNLTIKIKLNYKIIGFFRNDKHKFPIISISLINFKWNYRSFYLASWKKIRLKLLIRKDDFFILISLGWLILF